MGAERSMRQGSLLMLASVLEVVSQDHAHTVEQDLGGSVTQATIAAVGCCTKHAWRARDDGFEARPRRRAQAHDATGRFVEQIDGRTGIDLAP
jgi:hypothetical protein